jgi:hypothetical protein
MFMLLAQMRALTATATMKTKKKMLPDLQVPTNFKFTMLFHYY